MRYVKLLSFLFIVFLFNSCGDNKSAESVETEQKEEDVVLYNIRTNDFDVIVDTVKKGELLSQILLSSGLDSRTIHTLITKCDTVFNVRKFKSGNTYTRMYSDTVLAYFIYDIDIVNYLVFDLTDSLPKVYRDAKKVTYQERHATGVIESSLWNSMVVNNLDPNIAISLSEIYAWSIDFFGLQKGDFFKIVYVEKFVDSVSVGLEEIKYALFNHMGQDCYAIPFEQDGIKQFFDENGKSTRKAFLKAPLKYSRISSYFSHGRKHPVLKIVRPHHGVDYAAPVGTPVHTIGDGVVVKKGYSGGAGNMVTIKHNATYTTSYMHLSKYGKGIHQGARVRQGQVIGYVGSTGLSTGPHLDFRVYKNGTPINPLKMISPPSNPVKESDMPAFQVVRDSVLKVLSSF